MKSGEGLDGRDRRSFLRTFGAIAILGFADWLLQRSTNHPIWSLFGLIGLVAAFFIAAVTFVLAGQPLPDRGQYRTVAAFLLGTLRLVVLPAIGRLVRRLVQSRLAYAIVAVAMVAGYVVSCDPFEPPDPATCPHPVELKVLTSSDGAPSTRELLSTYERWTADTNTLNAHCPTVHAFSYAADRTDAITAVGRAWQADRTFDPSTAIGPRPDLWLPESTVEVRMVTDLAAQAKLSNPVDTSVSIGSSPMVIASKTPIAGLASAPPRWSDVVASVRSQNMGLLTADPRASTDGLFATASYLRTGQGTVSQTTARLLIQTVRETGAAAQDDGLTAICRFSNVAGGQGVAVITSEQLWQRYSQAQQFDGACPGETDSSRGGSVLRPADSLVLDHPFVEVHWNTAAQRSTVEAFRAWLNSSTGDRALRGIGLGAARRDCSDPEVGSHDPCVPANLGQLQEFYQSVQPPGVVLLGLDASGSMNDRVGRAGATRLALATGAAVQALGHIGQEDVFGLWAFHGETPPYEELLALGPSTNARRDQAASVLRRVTASGATALYRTILSGLAQVAATGTTDQRRAMVLVTDGQDTSSHLTEQATISGVAEARRHSGVQLFIIATGEAACGGVGGLRSLTDAGEGGCFDADPSEIAGTTAKLFESLWKGR